MFTHSLSHWRALVPITLWLKEKSVWRKTKTMIASGCRTHSGTQSWAVRQIIACSDLTQSSVCIVHNFFWGKSLNTKKHSRKIVSLENAEQPWGSKYLVKNAKQSNFLASELSKKQNRNKHRNRNTTIGDCLMLAPVRLLTSYGTVMSQRHRWRLYSWRSGAKNIGQRVFVHWECSNVACCQLYCVLFPFLKWK